MRIRRAASFLLCLAGCLLVLCFAGGITAGEAPALFGAVMANYARETMAVNAVASLYLNYRIFDTIFEALLLLVSVMSVIHFSRHEEAPAAAPKIRRPLSGAVVNSMSFLAPVILMLGVYLIVNGHSTPGGGFQGGAMLCAAMICRYLVSPEKEINLAIYQRIEKTLFILLAAAAALFAASGLYLQHTWLNLPYLVLMNFLIGLKVFCGLTIIFVRFVHYEDK